MCPAPGGLGDLSSGPMQASADPTSPAAPLPQGWHVAAPDYVGVGTARSGTTWWDSLINRHPLVSRAATTPKEVHFFDDRWEHGLGATDVERYHRLFARPDGHYAGEWTPGYMLDAWTPALLREAAPEARLLVMLRDPVERFQSGRTLAENRMTVGSTARAAANAAFNRGVYADRSCASGVPRRASECWCFSTSDVSLDPGGSWRARVRVHRPRTGAGAWRGPRRQGERLPRTKVSLSTWQTDQLAERYAPENERLAELVPELGICPCGGGPGDLRARARRLAVQGLAGLVPLREVHAHPDHQSRRQRHLAGPWDPPTTSGWERRRPGHPGGTGSSSHTRMSSTPEGSPRSFTSSIVLGKSRSMMPPSRRIGATFRSQRGQSQASGRPGI